MINFCSALDAIHKGLIDPDLVRKARQVEVSEFHRYGVTDIVPRSQFEEHKNREALAGTWWSDTNKGTEAEPDMHSRLCAREIKRLQETDVMEIAGNASDLFAMTLFSLLTRETFVQNWQEP